MHFDKKINVASGDVKKLETITFYNSTKTRVDMMNMMIDKV